MWSSLKGRSCFMVGIWSWIRCLGKKLNANVHICTDFMYHFCGPFFFFISYSAFLSNIHFSSCHLFICGPCGPFIYSAFSLDGFTLWILWTLTHPFPPSFSRLQALKTTWPCQISFNHTAPLPLYHHPVWRWKIHPILTTNLTCTHSLSLACSIPLCSPFSVLPHYLSLLPSLLWLHHTMPLLLWSQPLQLLYPFLFLFPHPPPVSIFMTLHGVIVDLVWFLFDENTRGHCLSFVTPLLHPLAGFDACVFFICVSCLCLCVCVCASVCFCLFFKAAPCL